MSTLNLTGFETGDASEAIAVGGTASIQGTTTRGAWSAYALRVNPDTTANGFFGLRGLGASGTSNPWTAATAVYARFYFRYDAKASSGDEPVCALLNSSNALDLEVRLNSSGNLAVYSGTPTLQATGSAVLSAGTWYRVEVKSDQSDAVNTVWEVRIDGVSDSSGSFAAVSAGQGSLRLGKTLDRNGNTVDYYFDDVLVSGSAYPGAGQSTLLLPNANGAYQTATIGAGAGANHYDKVNERPPDSDTTYLVTDGTATHAETEGLADTVGASVSGTINCAKALCVLKRDGASNGSVKQRRRSGSTDSDLGIAFATTAAYALCASVMDADPATSLAWTTGGIDGVEVGVVEQSANKSRMTFCALAVDYTPAAPSGTGRPIFRGGVLSSGTISGGKA